MQKLFKKIKWDSNFFGYNVAQIIVPHLTSERLKWLLDKLANNSFRLVYWFVEPNDSISNIAAKVNKGFLADQRVEYLKDLSSYPDEISNDLHLHSYLKKPINKQILSLVLQAGFYSRFARDKNFKKDEFMKLYTKWIERSLNGKLASDVLVYIDKNTERGLVTLELEEDYGKIGLVAVDKKYRRKGIGKQLISTALTKFKLHGVENVKVITQKDNISACKFYKKLGFVEQNIQNVYHFWLNGQKIA